MRYKFGAVQRIIVAVVITLGSIFVPSDTAKAAADLSISPITWNVIGLDSNNVNVGPNHFPIGVRVCNVGDVTATNVKSTFNFESGDPYIGDPYVNLRSGTYQSYTADGIDLAPASCVDFYYEVQIPA